MRCGFIGCVLLLIGSCSVSFAADTPFQKERGCVTAPAHPFGSAKSCSGSFTWPEGDEIPPGKYAIDVNSVSVAVLHRAGSSDYDCSEPKYTYKMLNVPNVGQVKVPVKVTVNYYTRSVRAPGIRGRIKCKITGNYIHN
ncbi:MAG: hypothetical protein D3907_02675 [Candidatus Electrothrix sp. AUS3]|nr:hypothetical protein [Candidatus Electrothrix gigas]